MDALELGRCHKRLQNNIPILGTWLRRKAARMLAGDISEPVVALLAQALSDADEQVRSIASTALRNTGSRNLIDELCRLAAEAPEGALAKLCVAAKKRPSDAEACALFLFVTRQLDEYFKEDFEFQNLHPAYDRASEKVRGHVMAVVRGGDRRCLGFFGPRKPLAKCSDDEIKLATDSAIRHKDWSRLFRVFQELPLRHSFPLLEHFRTSGWAPEQDDLRSLYHAALAESKGEALPAPKQTKETSPVFDRWLAAGREGELARLSEAELVQRLAKADPPDGVKIVAALATKAVTGSQAAKTVQQSPHWLVRLAGYATGLVSIALEEDGVKDDNYWVSELGGSATVLTLWPGKATPEDVEALNAAPREVFTGKIGAARRVLRLLLAHNMTTGVWQEKEEVVFEAGEFVQV